jgi:hypothetical protein
MVRILDANEKFVGKEPKFTGEITDGELASALTWYSQNKSTKDSQKFVIDYFKKKLKITGVASVLKGKPSQLGFICRVITNGASLSAERQEWFQKQIELIKEELAKFQTEEIIEDIKKGPNIQDRIRMKADECIGELEGQIDDMIVDNFSKTPSPFSVFHTMNIKGVHLKTILEWTKKKRTEFEEIINTDDDQLKEGYSNFKKTELKKIVAYCDQVILDCNKVSETSVNGRKPRKKKVKSPEQLTAKVKYCQEFKELNLTSVDIKSIIGCMQLWVYNTKQRKLGVYNASDAGGLSIKGSSIVNFNEEKSLQKKLRKPEVTLPEVLSGGKVFLRNVLENIRAVESQLSGRLNEDVIVLRIMK